MNIYTGETTKEVAKAIYERSVCFSEVRKGVFVDTKNKTFKVHIKDTNPFDEAIRNHHRYVFVGVYDYGAYPKWIEDDINCALKNLLKSGHIKTSWPANLITEE